MRHKIKSIYMYLVTTGVGRELERGIASECRSSSMGPG